MGTGTALVSYNSNGIVPNGNKNDMFLGEIMSEVNGNDNSIFYEKLLEIKNDIKSDMKLEFDKLNSKIDGNSNIVVELRIKNVAMEKDIESLKVANSNKNRWLDYFVMLAISGLVSFLMTRIR